MGRAIARWIGFGVILSMLPFLLAIGFCRIVGLEVEQTEYIPDLLLVTFAIAVNALSSTTDGFKNKVLSAIFSILSLISMIICSCGYFFLFGGILIVNKIIIDFAYLEDLILPLFDNFNWDWIILAAVILLVLNALMGLISEGGKGWAQNAKNSPPNSTPPNSTSPNSTSPNSTSPNSTPPNGTPPDSTPPDSTSPDSTPPDGTPPDSTPPNDTPPNDTPPNDTPPNDTPPDSTPPNSTPPKNNTQKAKGNSRSGRNGRRHK